MITILRAGAYISLVDKGRFGYQKYGVPISGAMDRHSAIAANVLLNNHNDEALLELYMPGHRLQFSNKAKIAITGADANIYLDDRTITSNQTHIIESGSKLSIGNFNKGAYIYIAVEGGLESKKILGSRSPLSNMYSRQLRTGDTIQTCLSNKVQASNSLIAPMNIDCKSKISARPGPEWDLLDQEAQMAITKSEYSISQQSNRMGYRLMGNPLSQKNISIYSSPVMPGTVQLLPSGAPLILMRDCQTTGGYPRILQITPDSLNQLAQRRPGQNVEFDVINGL